LSGVRERETEREIRERERESFIRNVCALFAHAFAGGRQEKDKVGKRFWR